MRCAQVFHIAGHRVTAAWQCERNMMRRSTMDTHIATLVVKAPGAEEGVVAVDVDEDEELGDLGKARDPLAALFAAVGTEVARTDPGAPALGKADFAWFLSFVGTFPSDNAFDVLSAPLTAWAEEA